MKILINNSTYTWHPTKLLSNLFTLLSLLLLIWIAVSYIDILISQGNGGTQWYNNYFLVLLRAFGKFPF